MLTVHTYLSLYIILSFALALRAQLCIILRACVVYMRGGDILDAVQPQQSRLCQFWMAYHQVGSNCSHTQRPEQETECQLCYVNCCCGVGCCMLPVQLNGYSMKLGGSALPLVRLTPQDHDHEFMHVVIELLHAWNQLCYFQFCSTLSGTTIAPISLCLPDKITNTDLINSKETYCWETICL